MRSKKDLHQSIGVHIDMPYTPQLLTTNIQQPQTNNFLVSRGLTLQMVKFANHCQRWYLGLELVHFLARWWIISFK